ncbi:MAG: four helix bundle protein [Candidatus Marinimicrobia bacterium]|nr:four helix bundle protein [Candidatus Neomarinimicrobiota bacterium]
MGSFDRFEDIEAWQKGRELVRVVYEVSTRGEFSKDFGLRDQIRRAGVSVVSNIAEGLERGGDREFIQFLSIAKGSAGEVKAQLYVAFDQGYMTRIEFDKIVTLADETRRLIRGLIGYLKQSDHKGPKFH